MRYALMLAMALALTSCGAMKQVELLAQKATITVEKANEILDDATATSAKIKAAVIEADKNKDGKVSGLELWDLLVALGAILGVTGTGLAAKANKKAADVERQVRQ